MDVISIMDLLDNRDNFEYAFLVMNASTYRKLDSVATELGVDRKEFKRAALLGIKDENINAGFDQIFVLPDFYELMRWAKTGKVISEQTAKEMEDIAPPPDHVYPYEDQFKPEQEMEERVRIRKEYREFNNQRTADLNAIREALDEKAMFGLSVEVLYSAFESIRCNPERTIADAVADGIAEWIK